MLKLQVGWGVGCGVRVGGGWVGDVGGYVFTIILNNDTSHKVSYHIIY